MKVCHMTSAHLNDDPRIFYKECVSLSKKGYEVILIAQGENFKKEGVHVIGFQPPRSRYERMIFLPKKILLLALEINADIYHFHDPELLSVGIKLKKRGKKVIFDCHEDYFARAGSREWIPKFLRKAVGILSVSYLKYVCKRLDAVVTVTPHLKRKFEGIAKNNVMITNYPLLTPVIYTTKRTKTTICFAGGISEQWNHETILKAIDKLPDINYLLIGPVKNEYMCKLAQYPSWDRVIYKKRMPPSEVFNELSACNIGMALCSYSENTNGKNGTLGNTKLFEMMMLGLPVIATDFELWKNIINEFNCGICVNPYDVDEIAKSINYLALNPNIAKQMGENGRKAVKEKYNWITQEQVLYGLYNDIILGHK